jgi:pSer/pThr/pTyr-binding forkhead associated (FHA) protein/DNA-directed RNA polymerase subunit RPC12/RpoP
MKITCPKCGHQELVGTYFCSDCGAKLITENGRPTTSFRASDSSSTITQIDGQSIPEIPEGGAQLSLHIMRMGQIIPLVDRNEYTIGRISQGQSILPDVDLTPFDAFSQGVSRLHATIKLEPDRVSISDLGSSNGSRINNNKIKPHQEYKLNHGDVISLGRFKIQVLIRQNE